VWEKAAPIDFSRTIPSHKQNLALDEYVLELIEKPITRKELYFDLHSTVRMRIEKARTRKLSTKVQEVANVKEVAVSIASSIRPSIEAHRFPEDFCPSNRRQQAIEIPSNRELTLIADRFMSNGNIKVEDADGNVVFEISQTAQMIELITRAILLGRRRFSVPVDEESVSVAVNALFPWLDSVNNEIAQGVNTSALGTRFEDQLRDAVLNDLRIANTAFAPEVWGIHHLPSELRQVE
jgi:hypothetical protein